MGDAAGELAERLELLRLVELLERALALRGTRLDSLLELGGERVQLLEPCARLILAATAAQRRAGEADQGGRMERPLEEGDVAQRVEQPRRRRIALETAAAPGEQDEREVRPVGLAREPRRESVQVGRLDRKSVV